MSDDPVDRYLQILSWRPRRDPKLLDDKPLFREMKTRIDALGLDRRVGTRLFLAAWALTDLQRQGPAFEHHRGGLLPQRQFTDLGKAARKFLDQLQAIDKEVEVLLAINLDDLDGSLPGLCDDLRRFCEAAEMGARETKRQRGGQRRRGTLRTFTLLMKRYEDATGDTVGRSATRNSDTDPHLSGLGGRFITEWFELVDPRVNGAALFRLWPSARKRLADGGPAIVSDDETLCRIESTIRNGLLSSQ